MDESRASASREVGRQEDSLLEAVALEVGRDEAEGWDPQWGQVVGHHLDVPHLGSVKADSKGNKGQSLANRLPMDGGHWRKPDMCLMFPCSLLKLWFLICRCQSLRRIRHASTE